MAYTSANLNLVSKAPLTGGGQEWTHFSADTGAQAQVDGFITDGVAKGLKVNDVVKHRNTATNIISTHQVVALNANGSVDMTDSTTFVSGTDTN